MPSKTYQQRQKERKLRDIEAWEALNRTKAFKEFCRNYQERIAQEVELLKNQDEYWPEPLREHTYDLVWHLQRAFLDTSEGEAVASSLGLWPLPSDHAVEVIKNAPATIIEKYNPDRDIIERMLDTTRHLDRGRFLTLRIDLSFPKEQILQGVEFNLDRYLKHYYRKLYGKPFRPSPPPRTTKILSLEEITCMYDAFDFIEEEGLSVLKTVWALWPDLEGRTSSDADDPINYKVEKKTSQVKRWHNKVKDKIKNL